MLVPYGLGHERERCLLTALDATEPLTSLSQSTRFTLRLSHLRGSCVLTVRPSFERVGTGRRMGQTAKIIVDADS